MKCPNCGSESGGRFCKRCGAPLPQDTQNPNTCNSFSENYPYGRYSDQNQQQNYWQQQGPRTQQNYQQSHQWKNQRQDYQQQNYQQQDYQRQDYQQQDYQRQDYQRQDYQRQSPQESHGIPPEYKPISMWGYFGYELLFSIPCVGLILLLVFSFGGTQNVNLKNFARSYFCLLIIAVVLILILAGIFGVGSITAFSMR